MLLGLAVLDPEGYAASRNAIRYEQTGKIDAWYLRALSADATPGEGACFSFTLPLVGEAELGRAA